MKWSYHVGTFRGIALKIHVTFALLVAVVAGNWGALGAAGIAFGLGLMGLLFACVTLHEFGHALAAQRFGIPVREIVLLPIGGVALLGRNPRDAVQELVIAAAGPAVNVVIAAALVPVLWILGEPLTFTAPLVRPDTQATLSVGEAARWLLGANVSLVLFNLIPAFPLDGGRILRGLLGLRLSWTRATEWATSIGQGLALAMGGYGLFTGQLNLVIIAALVFVAAGATQVEERTRAVLGAQRVGEACNRHALALSESDQLSTVVRYLLTSYQPDFPVMRGPDLMGVVLRTDVLRALERRAGDASVTTLMTTCPRLRADQSLAEAYAVLHDLHVPVAAVYDARGFLGLVGAEDLREAQAVLQFVMAPLESQTAPRVAYEMAGRGHS